MSYSEEEQLEQLKKFWNDHGTSLLTGALIAVLAYGGWGYWNGSKVKDASEASSLYQSASTAMQKLAANPTDLLLVGSRHHWMEGSLARLLIYKLPIDIQICHEPYSEQLKAVG